MTSGSATFNLDYQDDQWGWNEYPARGADTFHPFSHSIWDFPIMTGETTSGFKVTANAGIYPAYRIFDGNVATSWISYGIPSILNIQFDKVRPFIGIAINNSSNTSAVFKNYKIETSTDGVSYSELTNGTQPSSYPYTKALVIKLSKAVTAKYVRITFESSYDNGFDISGITFI